MSAEYSECPNTLSLCNILGLNILGGRVHPIQKKIFSYEMCCFFNRNPRPVQEAQSRMNDVRISHPPKEQMIRNGDTLRPLCLT
jgi:hypothetical protein